MNATGAWIIVIITLCLLAGAIVQALQGDWLPAIWFAIMWVGINNNVPD